MKSKNKHTNIEQIPESLSRRNAIITGAGAVAAIGAASLSSQTNAKEGSTTKKGHNMEGATSVSYTHLRAHET